MNRKQLPEAGVRLKRVVALEQKQGIHIVEEEPPQKRRRIGFAWNWRVSIPEEREIEILLNLTLGPSEKAPEEVELSVIGEFEVGTITAEELQRFVRFNGPAIVLPYARQMLSDLTGRGPFGAFQLPIINLASMMKSYSYEDSMGARQLNEDPSLAKLFASPPNVLEAVSEDEPET